MMKRKRMVLVVVACLLGVGIGSLWLRRQRQLLNGEQCLSALRSIGTAIALYRHDYGGELPTDLAPMFTGHYLSDGRLLVCPWGSKSPGSWASIADWEDYLYVPWSSAAGVYAKYPLMYDRRLSNHDGRGINVLLVEQTEQPASPTHFKEAFHGQFFWDEGARWLRAFAREHPDLAVPLPEGLQAVD